MMEGGNIRRGKHSIAGLPELSISAVTYRYPTTEGEVVSPLFFGNGDEHGVKTGKYFYGVPWRGCRLTAVDYDEGGRGGGEEIKRARGAFGGVGGRWRCGRGGGGGRW